MEYKRVEKSCWRNPSQRNEVYPGLSLNFKFIIMLDHNFTCAIMEDEKCLVGLKY